MTGPITTHLRVRVTNIGLPTDFGASAADATIANGRLVTTCTPVAPKTIPDNDPTWTELPLSVTSSQLTRGLRVSVDISHPYPPTSRSRLMHPDGTTVMLRNFAGAGTQNVHETYGIAPGLTIPFEPFTKLYGKVSTGTWRLRVRDLHPGDVGTVNQWCLTVVGPTPGTYVLTAPNGGEGWPIGSTQTIAWTATNIVSDTNVSLSRDGGATWTTLGTVPPGTKQFTWTVTGPATQQARVRIQASDEPAEVTISNANFTIQNPTLQVLQPNGGENLATGQPYLIKWLSVPQQGTVKIELSRNGGASFTTVIASAAPDTGSYLWTVGRNLDTTQARIRITANGGAARSGASSANFTIKTSSLTVTSPGGGEVWYTYTPHAVTWTSVGVTGTVRVELFHNNMWQVLADNVSNTGTYTLTVPGPATTAARIRVTSDSDPRVSGTSTNPFEIRTMTVTVLSPNGGETVGTGTTQTIRWSTQGVPGNVNIALSGDGGATFQTLAFDTPNTGSYTWNVGQGLKPGKSYLVRVTAHGLPSFDVSDHTFTVVTPAITLVKPNGGEQLRIGQTYPITWTTTGVTGNVKIELSRDGGVTWETLFANASNGSAAWTVTGPATDAAAQIRITSLTQAHGERHQQGAVLHRHAFPVAGGAQRRRTVGGGHATDHPVEFRGAHRKRQGGAEHQ